MLSVSLLCSGSYYMMIRSKGKPGITTFRYAFTAHNINYFALLFMVCNKYLTQDM